MSQLFYYGGLFGLSFLLAIVYAFQWRKQFDDHMTVIFVMIPTVNLAYFLMYSGHELEAVVSLLKIIYIGGCFLPWLAMLCIMSLCGITVSRPIRLALLLLSASVYLSVLTIGYNPLFYQSISLERVGDVWVQNRNYGPLHAVHYGCVAFYMIADLAAIFYSYKRKKQVSRRVLILLSLPIFLTVAGYAIDHYLMKPGYELLPVTYTFALLVYCRIAYNMSLYNVSEMVVESMVRSGNTGFITVDTRGRYLGSNETARVFLPELNRLAVDRSVRDDPALKETVVKWLDAFQENPESGHFLYAPPTKRMENAMISGEGSMPETDEVYGSKSDETVAALDHDDAQERICTVEVSDLYYGRRHCGYQIFLRDDTQNQKYIRLLDQYNTDLQEEVEAKTGRIVVMHDRLILAMAAMVESRDNSTGGHIRRTSEGVRILIETIRKDGELQLSDIFCRNIIKAAPMHDLGKIAVDDAVLRKPGRFTPEEFEKMKAHAAEGARIVHEILQDTDDEEFRRIAENVAHYHHERWDGSGYPDKLKGEEIPLEARIMAIADVYDALVSKRVYKEAFSFDRANQIIMEGMGTQFDPELEQAYRAARPRLERYYEREGERADQEKEQSLSRPG